MKTIFFTLSIALVFLTSCGTSKVITPEYRDIKEIKVVDVGLLQTTAGFDLVYYNPNNFGVTLTQASGDVYVDNQFLGKFDLKENVTVKKRSEFVVPALIKIDMIGVVKNYREIWKKKEALVRIDGRANVRKAGINKEIPLKYETMQNLEKFRSLIAL